MKKLLFAAVAAVSVMGSVAQADIFNTASREWRPHRFNFDTRLPGYIHTCGTQDGASLEDRIVDCARPENFGGDTRNLSTLRGPNPFRSASDPLDDRDRALNNQFRWQLVQRTWNGHAVWINLNTRQIVSGIAGPMTYDLAVETCENPALGSSIKGVFRGIEVRYHVPTREEFQLLGAYMVNNLHVGRVVNDLDAIRSSTHRGVDGFNFNRVHLYLWTSTAVADRDDFFYRFAIRPDNNLEEDNNLAHRREAFYRGGVFDLDYYRLNAVRCVANVSTSMLNVGRLIRRLDSLENGGNGSDPQDVPATPADPFANP